MKTTRIITIFALRCGGEIYVGKTSSDRISAVYYRHCRGEIRTTKVFSTLGMKPKLHILQRKNMESFQAYQWIIAYVHFFQAAGYEIMNSVKTIERAGDLHPETQILVSEIQKETADQLLVKTLVMKPSEADIRLNPEESVLLTPANHKLTVRLSQWEKMRFDRIAETMHLSQRETIQYLISKLSMPNEIFPPWEEDVYIRAIMGALREENEKLRAENLKYKNNITIKEDETMKPIVDLFEQLRVGCKIYFSLMESACPIPVEIERRMYKNYPQAGEYRYPDQAGVYIFRPHAILTGKGRYPARFIVGTGEDGTEYKFRYYPKTYFTGIPPSSKKFMLRGSIWLMGCQRSQDGAMDLIFAFPLYVRYESYAPKTSDSIAQELISNILGCDTADEHSTCLQNDNGQILSDSP